MKLKVLALAHPSAILRGGFGLEAAQITYLRRLRSILLGKREWTPIDTTQPQPGAIHFPTLTEIQLYFSLHRKCAPTDDQHPNYIPGVPLRPHGLYTADIEAAGPHIRCIGFCCWGCERYLQVPFRLQGGVVYWPSYLALCSVVEFLDTLFSDPDFGLIWHFGVSYDMHELDEVGFDVLASYAGDTLHMQRHAFAEAPAGLQYCGILYGWLPAWKRLVKAEEEIGEGK